MSRPRAYTEGAKRRAKRRLREVATCDLSGVTVSPPRRRPDARIAAPRADETETVALARLRRMAAPDTPDNRKRALDPLRGFALGRAYLSQRITAAQLDAGCRFALALDAERALAGYPAPTPRAAQWGAAGGRSLIEPREEAVRRAKADVATLRSVLHRVDPWAFAVVERVAILDREPYAWRVLRLALSALVRHYGLPDDDA